MTVRQKSKVEGHQQVYMLSDLETETLTRAMEMAIAKRTERLTNVQQQLGGAS